MATNKHGDYKYPPLEYVILKFETAALCTDGLASLNVTTRQRKRWAVEALDAVRLKLSYGEPKALPAFSTTV